MNELKPLEDRLKLATDRISAALSGKDNQNDQLAAAQEVNANLQQKLSTLRNNRERDLEVVNQLIEQIRPLVEGGEDA